MSSSASVVFAPRARLPLMVRVPIELPGAMMPLLVTRPVMVPLPPKVPAAPTVTLLVRLPFTWPVLEKLLVGDVAHPGEAKGAGLTAMKAVKTLARAA